VTRVLPRHVLEALARSKTDTRASRGSKPAVANTRGELNGLEERYLADLDMRRLVGEVDWVGKHESLAFKLASGATFRPDFPVLVNGRLELHEVKGFWREAARVRIKVAAALYPFRFVAVRWVSGGWQFEEFR
jgi:hypothetical protein